MTLPKELKNLEKIALNYWWSFNQDSWELFSIANPEVWAKTRNPVLSIKNSTNLESLVKNSDYMKKLETVYGRFQKYMTDRAEGHSWYSKNYPNNGPIAYFSAEFGIHEALPIYSGGLGVLSGDHTKSASDLGIPMVFVGLFYKNGYFTQKIDGEGKQKSEYPHYDPADLSIELVRDSQGTPVHVEVDLAGVTVKLQAYKAMIGISTLYMIDSNVEGNSPEHRELTARLYGGDREMRISQEIILGIGGVRLIDQLKIQPLAYHMNEGHSGFFQLERIRLAMKKYSLHFEEARVVCSSNCVFTTHTPVPAGNESFMLPLMHKYFHQFIKEFNISWRRFVELGLVPEKSDYKYFSLTVFAINVAQFYNGVSELHGKLAKKMWRDQWAMVPEAENPISYITNGIHVQTWMALEVKNLLNNQLGLNWEDELANHEYWKQTSKIQTDDIKNVKLQMKRRMIEFVRSHLKKQLFNAGESAAEVQAVDGYLNENALIIGFARRFATYKRATLIFKDLKRLEKLVNDPERPLFFVFAGKAHPADTSGQKYIEDIYKYSRMPQFKGKIIILENYDMNVSRHLISGSDVWLNNPRRPMEASGTSGQKVPINFGLNFSVLDGWWREGFNGENGWAIGEEKDFPSDEIQDFEDAQNFYRTLNETVLPLYYKGQKSGASTEWIEKSKVSFITNISHFSTHRMVQDYMTQFYKNAIHYGQLYRGNLELAKTYVANERFLRTNWSSLHFTYLHFDSSHVELKSEYNSYFNLPGHHVEYPIDKVFAGRIFDCVQSKIYIGLYLGDINPEHILVEAVAFEKDHKNFTTYRFERTGHRENGVEHYALNFAAKDSSPKELRFRAIGSDQFLNYKFEYGRILWY